MVQLCSRLRAKEKGLENRLLFLLFWGKNPIFLVHASHSF